MKVELRVVKGGAMREAHPEPTSSSFVESSDEAAIDIAQVLAANQALLKNVCRRMEHIENKLSSVQGILDQQQQRLALEGEQRLLLAAPPKPVAAWQPNIPKLDSFWYNRFNFWTKLFHPEKMRRPSSGE
ncbi:MAG: hypothetical protein WA705_01165 [Candidatus Ozemobacteraceae bacterium]